MKRYDITGNIIAYEEGELNNKQTIALFQQLVDSGLAWTLQGHYGRVAKQLLDTGVLRAPRVRAAATQQRVQKKG